MASESHHCPPATETAETEGCKARGGLWEKDAANLWHQCLIFLSSIPLHLLASPVCQGLPHCKLEGKVGPRAIHAGQWPRMEKGGDGSEGKREDTQLPVLSS